MSSQNPLLPLGISFKNWASQLAIDLPHIDVGIPPSSGDWRSWASQLLTDNNLKNVPLPTGHLYKGKHGWVEWAKVFVSNLK